MLILDNLLDAIRMGGKAILARWGEDGDMEAGGNMRAHGFTVIGDGKGLTFPDGSFQPTAADIVGAADWNTVSRYQMVTAAGIGVNCVSSSTVFKRLPWARAGTALTVTHAGHGHAVGEAVNLRNTNVANNQYSIITAVTANTFTVTVGDVGPVSGSGGAYSMGFTFAHSGAAGTITGGTLTAPQNSDVQLLSLRIHLAANTRSVQTYLLVLPQSIVNGAGGGTNNDDVYVPNQQVRQDNTFLTAVGNTIATAINGSYASFQFGALPAATTGIQLLMQF